MTADLNMSYGSSSKGDRTAAPGHQLVMPFLRCGAPDGCSAVTVRPMLCKLPPWSEWACKKAGREVYRQWGSGAVPKRELQKKKKSQLSERVHLKQTFLSTYIFQASFIWMKLHIASQWKPFQGELRSTLTMTRSTELLSGVTLCLWEDIILVSETDMSPYANYIHEG